MSEKESIIVSFDLTKDLSQDELERFRENAAAAGRTPEEHFRALTIGVPLTTAFHSDNAKTDK